MALRPHIPGFSTGALQTAVSNAAWNIAYGQGAGLIRNLKRKYYDSSRSDAYQHRENLHVKKPRLENMAPGTSTYFCSSWLWR